MEGRLLAIYKQLSNVWNPTLILASQIEKWAMFTSRIWQDYTRASAKGNRRKGAKFEQWEWTHNEEGLLFTSSRCCTEGSRNDNGSAKNSKEEGSLNDCLQVGENHIPHIFDMLTKFRYNAVGLTADIEKALFLYLNTKFNFLFSYNTYCYEQTHTHYTYRKLVTLPLFLFQNTIL